jgi:hypothetical protein
MVKSRSFRGKKTKNNRSKKYGGAFTGNQLYDLFKAEYDVTTDKKDTDEIAKKSINVDVLDKSDGDGDLYNDTFRVYFEPEQIRFIIVHRGTAMDSLYDWGDNVRNVLFSKTKLFITKRNIRAKKGHERLKTYLMEIYDNNDKSTTNKSKIYDAIYKYKQPKDSQIKEITTEEAVDELLKNTLSTIGHSQGAVYCYLYGKQGKETIVFNPAPFMGKKPDNVYMVKVKGDIVSSLATSGSSFATLSKSTIKTLDKKQLTGDEAGMFNAHFIGQLRDDATILGNKQLFSHDKELKDGSNKNFLQVIGDSVASLISTDKQQPQGGSKRKTKRKTQKRKST